MDYKRINKDRQDAVYASYLEELHRTGMSGHSVKETATKFGITTSRVYQILKKYGNRVD